MRQQQASSPSSSSVSSHSSSAASSSSSSSILSRALTSNSEWPEKEDFLDVLYWFKQILGVVLGLVFGVSGFTGAFALGAFGALNAGLGYAYCTGFQGVDEEEFGGAWELTKEGFMTSFAGFLVTWIIMYSGLHFD